MKASSKSSQLPIEFSGRLFNQCRAGPLSFKGGVFDGVEVIAAGQMNAENEVFDPHRGVRCSIV